MSIQWSAIHGIISDMDGVLWRGDIPLLGMTEFFTHLQNREVPHVLATNNSAKSPSDYVTKLSKMGVNSVLEKQIITSSTATVDYLKNHFPEGTCLHVLGGAGLKYLIQNAGYILDTDERPCTPSAVIVGIDLDLTYTKLKRAALLIQTGIEFIGTNEDASLPVPEGLAPGAGSIIAALKTATRRTPRIIGKPNPPMFETALRLLQTAPQNTLMIGDRMDTDILGAQALGIQTALVFSGVTTEDMMAQSLTQPTQSYLNLEALIQDWQLNLT